MEQIVPSRRARKKQETRAALLAAALELFHQKGIVSTRVEQITDRVDVAKGVFYNYFGSKDEIIYSLVVEGVEILRNLLSSEINTKWSLDRRIMSIIETHDVFFRTYPTYAILFQQARGVMETKSSNVVLLQKGFKRYLEVLSDHLFQEDVKAKLSKETISQYSAALAGAIAGYRSYCLVSEQKLDLQIIASILTTGIIHTILTTE